MGGRVWLSGQFLDGNEMVTQQEGKKATVALLLYHQGSHQHECPQSSPQCAPLPVSTKRLKVSAAQNHSSEINCLDQPIVILQPAL